MQKMLPENAENDMIAQLVVLQRMFFQNGQKKTFQANRILSSQKLEIEY